MKTIVCVMFMFSMIKADNFTNLLDAYDRGDYGKAFKLSQVLAKKMTPEPLLC